MADPTPESIELAVEVLADLDDALLQDRPRILAAVLDDVRRIEVELDRDRIRARLIGLLRRVDGALETVDQTDSGEAVQGG